MTMVENCAPTRTGLADLSVSYSHAKYKTTQRSRKSPFHFAKRQSVKSCEEPKIEDENAATRKSGGNPRVPIGGGARRGVANDLFDVYPAFVWGASRIDWVRDL
jgi:hypothetical protein